MQVRVAPPHGSTSASVIWESHFLPYMDNVGGILPTVPMLVNGQSVRRQGRQTCWEAVTPHFALHTNGTHHGLWNTPALLLEAFELVHSKPVGVCCCKHVQSQHILRDSDNAELIGKNFHFTKILVGKLSVQCSLFILFLNIAVSSCTVYLLFSKQ